MIKKNIKLPKEKLLKIKSLQEQGLGIRESARQVGVSYYCAWHIKKGSYDREGHLDDCFKSKEDNGFFSWNKFEVY